MQIYFEYPSNYIAKEESLETNANALLLSNNKLDSGIDYSTSGTSSILFTFGPINSIAKTITDIYVISNNLTQITWTGNANPIKKTRIDSDRQPTTSEFFFERVGSIDYSLISVGAINNTITLSFSRSANASIFEVYLLRRLGIWQKIDSVDYNPPENRNEYIREGFYGSLSKQRVSNVRHKRSAGFTARGTRAQMAGLEEYAKLERITFAANARLEPTLVYPAILEINGPRTHAAQWQSNAFRMPYTVREI